MDKTGIEASVTTGVSETPAPSRWALRDLKDRIVTGGSVAAILPLLEQARAWVENINALGQWWPFLLSGALFILTYFRVRHNAKKRIEAVLVEQAQLQRRQLLRIRVGRIEESTKGVATYSRVPEEDRDPGHDLPRYGWIRLSDAHEMVRVSAQALVEEFRRQRSEGYRLRNEVEVTIDREQIVEWLASIGDEQGVNPVPAPRNVGQK